VASYLLSRTLVPSLSRRMMRSEELAHEREAGGTAGAAGTDAAGTNTSEAVTKPYVATGGDINNAPTKVATPVSLDVPPPRAGAWARFGAWRDRGFERMRDGYGRALESCITHRGKLLVGVLVLAGIGLSLLTVVGLDFFPRVDTGQMRLHVRAPTGRRIEDTEQDVARVEQAIRTIIPADELQTVNDNIGVPTFYNLAFVSTDNVGGWDAEVLIQLRPKHHPTDDYRKRLRAELGERFPELKLYFMPADVVTQVLNFGVSAMIDVQVEGRDPQASFEVARHLFDRMRRIPGAEDVRIAQVFDRRALRLDVDRQQAAQLNLSVRDIANSMLTSLSSSLLTAPSFWLDPKTGVNYNVVVQTPLPQVASVPALLDTAITPAAGFSTIDQPLATNTPTPSPLQQQTSDLATPVNMAPYVGGMALLRSTGDRASINHYTVQPIVDVQASVEGRDLGGVASDVRRLMAETKLPKGVKLTLRGQAESMTTSFRDLGAGMIVAIILVYLLLTVLFQSLLDPLIVMVAVPGSFVGILWMLALTGTTLNVESFMGSIMAVGIAVSNSILLVSFANEARSEDESLSAHDAAVAAGRTRLRPVLMTAMAMILGMLPMAFGLGEGGEQNAPLGRAVIGGLLVATLVTLFVVPTIYTLLRRKPPGAHAFDQRFAAEARGASAAAMGEADRGGPPAGRRPPEPAAS